MTAARRRCGFTLIEVTVALVIGGMAVAGAAALLLGLGDRAEAIERAAARVDRDANVERLLRALVANLDLGGDTTAALTGDATSVAFRTWCEVPAGWLERCRVHLSFDRSVLRLRIRDRHRAAIVDLEREVRAGAVRYLVTPAHGGEWAERWSHITAPPAIAVIADGDTLLLRVWGGG